MTDNNKKPDKPVKAPAGIHQDIKIFAAKEGREMREVVVTAFKFYEKYRNEIKDDK
ncbi:MAG: hypothetical protein ACQEWU_10360 [Bacillota bacterium]